MRFSVAAIGGRRRSDNRIDDWGVAALGAGLAALTRLTVLDLG